MTKKLEAGDVVKLYVHYGTSTKVRPGIIVEITGDRAYVLLGSTKNVLADQQTVIVTEPSDLRKMGLNYCTGFRWGSGGDQWVSLHNVERITGRITQPVVDAVGQAWANAKFSRLL